MTTPAETPAPERPPDEPMSVAAGTAYSFISQAGGNLGYFVSVLILSRALPPSGRGTVAFLTTLAVVVSAVSHLGVRDATMVFLADGRRGRDRLLTNLAAATVGMTLVGGLLAAAILSIPGVRPAGVTVAAIAVLVGAGVAAGLDDAGHTALIGLGRFRVQTVLVLVAPWLYAALLAVCWIASSVTPTRAFVLWGASQALGGVLLFVASFRHVGMGRPDPGLFRQAVPFGLRAWPGGLARFLNFRADQVLMGFISTEAALGFYATAVNVADILLYLPGAVGSAIVPIVASRRRSDQTLSTFRGLTVITLAGIAIGAALGPFALPFVFGEPYQRAVAPFLWLLPGALGCGAFAIFSTALLTSGAPALGSLGPVASFVVGFAADLLLIPRWGADGAAIAATFAWCVGGATAAIIYRRRERFSWSDLLPRTADAGAVVAGLRATLRRLRSTAPA